MYSVLEENDRKALIKVLSQKRRLQEEMLNYLALSQKEKESGHEDPDIQQLLKAMPFSQWLDPQTSFSESELIKEDLLKRIGEHYPQYDSIKVLAMK